MQIKYLLPILAVGVLLVLMLNHTMSIGNMRNAYEAEFQAQPTLGMETIQEGRLHSVCRHNYKVPLWSGKEALVCDPAVCEGADKLRPMAIILHKQRRWSPADETTYTTFYRTGHFDGWVDEPHIRYVRALTDLQHRMGILGTVGEIGVHHGKFLMPIVGYALQEEPAVAVDLFEDQAQNFDGSGRGSTAALLQNLKSVGIDESQVRRIAANSMHLKANNISAHGLPSFRMISVDGGHSVENTLHDMMLATCLLLDGGIMIVDDVTNPAWLGVQEAMFHFIFANKRMVPLLMGHNKAYFTTVSHVEQYRRFLRDNPTIFACMYAHVSRRPMAGHELCFVESTHT